MTPEHSISGRVCRENLRLRMTRHAEIRAFDHRMIPPAIIDALVDYGESDHAGNGCEKVHFTKRSWRQLHRHFGPALKAMERYRNCYAVVASNGAIVTVGWLH